MYDKETQQIIADLDKQAKEIQAKIDELKNGVVKKNVRWRAEGKGKFFYVNMNSGSIVESEDCGWANMLYGIGNYFKTLEEAEKYKQHLIVTQKIKDIALRLNDGMEIDWNNHNQPKWLLSYSNKDFKLKQWELYELNYLNIAYCLSDKFLETCIKEIGEKELIEYIKWC